MRNDYWTYFILLISTTGRKFYFDIWYTECIILKSSLMSFQSRIGWNFSIINTTIFEYLSWAKIPGMDQKWMIWVYMGTKNSSNLVAITDCIWIEYELELKTKDGRVYLDLKKL